MTELQEAPPVVVPGPAPVGDGGAVPRRSHWVVAGLVALLLVAALPLSVSTRADARDGRDEAQGELAAAADEEARQRIGLADDRATLVGTVEGRAASDAATEAAWEQVRLLLREIIDADLTIQDVATALADGEERLEAALRSLGIQQAAMEPLRRCVDGMGAVNRALSRSDFGAASAALDRALPACARVRTASKAPALPFDFPDPDVVRGAGRWWAYATNSTAGAVQLASSTNLRDWRIRGNALARVPRWAQDNATWAPEVIFHAGRWLLYYTVRERRSGLQCISVATSSSPAGPFRDDTQGPLVCERGEGGSIDPEPVRDFDDRLYLLWKTELDTRRRPAQIRGSELTGDGLGLVGETKTLLTAQDRWEGRTIEAPAMLQWDGYHLLYSAGSWNSAGYGVGVSSCETILGPCVRHRNTPAFGTGGGVAGPGGLALFDDGARVGTAYHGWQGTDIGYPHSRFLYIGDVAVDRGRIIFTR